MQDNIKTMLTVFAVVEKGTLVSYGIAFGTAVPAGAVVVSTFGEIVGGPEDGQPTQSVDLTYEALGALGLAQADVLTVKQVQIRCELYHHELTRPLND